MHTHTHTHTHTPCYERGRGGDIIYMHIYIYIYIAYRVYTYTPLPPPHPHKHTHLAANEGAVENGAGLAYVLLRNKTKFRTVSALVSLLAYFQNLFLSRGNIFGICTIFRICATVTRYYFQNL
jgi:hypothetical protein